MSEPIQIHIEKDPVSEAIASERRPAAAGFMVDGVSEGGISSVDQLQREAPKVYRGMLESIAQTICGDLRRSSERIKEIMREEQDNH